MKAVGIVFISFMLLFGCTGTNNEPTQIVNDFLSSIHSGNIKKAETYVDGKGSREVMDLVKELWRKNPSSFTKNPNYSLSVISNDGKTAIVNVADEFNNMNFELKLDEGWKMNFQTCGIIDLVRGNTRDPESYSDDYIMEIGDLEEGNNADELKNNESSRKLENERLSLTNSKSSLQSKKWVNCRCGGSGKMRKNGSHCRLCGGKGQTLENEPKGFHWVACPKCSGSGDDYSQYGNECRICSGRGQVLERCYKGCN